VNWFTPSDFTDEGAPVSDSNRKLNIEAVNDGVVRFFGTPCALIVSIGATLGRVGFSEGAFSCNQQINVVVPAAGMDAKFLFYALLAKRETMKVICNATTLGIMNQETTRQIDIPAPLIDEQVQIAKFLDYEVQKFENLALSITEAINRLAEYHAALITAATTGKIDLRNVKIPVLT
jgi:type I restriction enzyme S subunit